MLDQLLDLIEGYLGGEVAIRALETWVVSSVQPILDSDDEEAINAINEVDASLVEYGMGVLDDDLLEKRFRDVVFAYRKGMVVVPCFPQYEVATYRVETTSGTWTSHASADLVDREAKDYRVRKLVLA